MLISGSTVFTCAASSKSLKSIASFSKKTTACPAKSMLYKLIGCTENCDLNRLLGLDGGACRDGSCNEDKSKDAPVAVTPKPSAKKDQSGFNSSYEDEVIKLVNEEREKKGLTKLAKDNGASSVARLRAKEIVESFSHSRPDGSSCFTAASELGVKYRSAGENIAYGYPSPKKVMEGWMNSDGHRRNILSSSYTKIGVGCYKSGGTLYWTQFFIS